MDLKTLKRGTDVAAQRPDPRSAWPFAPLTGQQQRERSATEAALRNLGMRVFRAFDDTVAGALT